MCIRDRFDNNTASRLTKIASAIANQHNGEISFLDIINVPKQTPLSIADKFDEVGLGVFDDFKKSISHSIRHRYMVKLCHDPTEAILSTVEEQSINLLIVDFSFLKNKRKILSLSTCDIMGVKLHKNFEKDISNLIISYDKGRHSNSSLEIAHSLSMEYESRIRIVRGVTQPPEVEIEIVNKINECMFDLDIKKVQFENVYPKTDNMLVSSELLANFNQDKHGIIFLGAGNQADAAFSPKTLSLANRSKKTVIILRNHLFSEFHTRSIWGLLATRFKQNKHVYRIYVETLQLFYSIRSNKEIKRYYEDYFESKF